jgi:hypothetical protein
MVDESEIMSVAIQVMSDLHLETPRFMPMYEDFNFQPTAPHLALLGDIGNVYNQRLFSFLEAQLLRYKVVFFLLGNHEPYGEVSGDATHSYEDAVDLMERFESTASARRESELAASSPGIHSGQFIFLNRRRFDFVDSKVTVLGTTLHSRVSEEQRTTVSLFVSDFSNIKNWSVEKHNEAHERDLQWLNSQVQGIFREQPDQRIIIFTHHSPTDQPDANDPERLEGIQTAFVTRLEDEVCWTCPSVRAWVFGHTHYNCNFIDSKTGKMVVANQRGYGREDAFDFDPGLYVEI